jgi:hypothetical protein
MASRKRTLAAFAAGALVAPLLPIAVSPAFAAPPDPPPVQSTEDLCANVPEDFEPFQDINGNTFKDVIECAAFAEIALGGPAGLPNDFYGPRLEVRRDQMASFIVRVIDTANQQDTGDNIAELPPYDGTPEFTDVPEDNVHFETVNRLAQEEIVLGGPGDQPDSEYGPALPVSRAQMASFINRAIGFMTGDELETSDDYFTDDEGNVHEDNINGIASEGIAVGDGVDSYDPKRNVPRDQMAAFLIRSLAVLEEDGDIAPFRTPAEPEIQVSPDSVATLTAESNPDDTSADDRRYTVDGLDEGQEYRITLVVEGNIGENAEGETTFEEDGTTGLAATGMPTADISQVNGEAPQNNMGNGTELTDNEPGMSPSVVFIADSEMATFTVDGDDAPESVQPVVYYNGGGDGENPEGGDSPRLELNEDGTPSEEFDVGGVVNFVETATEPPPGEGPGPGPGPGPGEEPVLGTGVTDAPELIGAQFVRTTNNRGNESTTVRYTFDEDVVADVDEDSFFLYTFDGEQITTDDDDNPPLRDPDDALRDPNDESSVLVVFPVTARDFADVTLATVDRGAVQDRSEAENPIGDAPIGAGVTFEPGRTDAPDLVSIDNFREDTATESATAVDFTFDEPAFVVDPTTGQFQLIQPDGNDLLGTPVERAGGVQGDGTQTITVSFADPDSDGDGTTEPITAEDVARAVVLAGTVSDAAPDDDGNLNPLQATDSDVETTLPDLASATIDEGNSTVTYTFDQDVVVVDETLFQVYDRDGTEFSGTDVSGADNDPDDSTVVVVFEGGALDAVTGASVDEGAVRQTGGARVNQEDEVGASSDPVAAGTTVGPDLTDVIREIETRTTTNPFTGEQTTEVTGVTLRFIFDDEANLPEMPTGFEGQFFVVAQSGERFELTRCEEANQTTVSGDENVIVCDAPQDNDRIRPGNQGTEEFEAARDAVLGTVEAGAVTDDEGTDNPEGAEAISGA